MAIMPLNGLTPASGLTAGQMQIDAMNAAASAAKLAQASGQAQGAGESGFQQVLAQAIDGLKKVDQTADEKTVQFLTGDAEDIHDVMIAQEKAGLAFQLTMAVRNKVVEAYTTVMQMQI